MRNMRIANSGGVCEHCEIVHEQDEPDMFYCVLNGPMVDHEEREDILYHQSHARNICKEDYDDIWEEIGRLQDEEYAWKLKYEVDPSLVCDDFTRCSSGKRKDLERYS